MPNRQNRQSSWRRLGHRPQIAIINIATMIGAGSFSVGLPAALAQQPALSETQTPSIPKEELRYAGRSFSDWRRQLLTDLDPKTQVAAIEALLAFGKKGYEEGAVAAIGQVLSTATEQVQGAAFEALGQLGPTSVPVLIGALRDKNISVRVSAAATLARLGPAAQAALDPLRQAVQDEDSGVRHAAALGLAKVGAGEKRLQPAFEQLARSADMQMRFAVLSGLADAIASNSRFVPMFLRALQDDQWEVRRLAGGALIRGGPPNSEVVEGLTELVCEDIEGLRRRRQFDASAGSVVLSLAREERNIDTVAPVLAIAATTVLADGPFLQASGVDEFLAALMRVGSKAAPAVPALTKFIAIDSPAREPSIVLAIDVLGSLGQSARQAVPALEAWLALGERPNVDLRTIHMHAVKALRNINKTADASSDRGAVGD